MSATDTFILQILAVSGPVFVLLIALGMLWLTRWEVAREDRRRTQRHAAGE